MGLRNGGFRDDESAAVDALLFTTMCIIGLPVDVHIKDGSVYSGIFHTACVEDDYAIVLKKARIVKKGNRDANVAKGGLIETLVVLSEDLVQVVAKRVLLPSEGCAGNVSRDETGAVAGTYPSKESTGAEVKTEKSGKKNVDRLNIRQTRCSSGLANGSSGIANVSAHGPTKKVETLDGPVYARQIGGDRLPGEPCNKEKSEFLKEETNYEVQRTGPSPSPRPILDSCDTQSNVVEDIHGKTCNFPANGVHSETPASSPKLDHQHDGLHTSSEALSVIEAAPSKASAAASSVVDAASKSCVSLSSPTESVLLKSSNSNKTTKEFKLNPGADVFSPSISYQRSVTSPAIPTGGNMTYIPESYPGVPVANAQQEIEINPYAPRPSLPVKLVPYGNLLAGNGGTDVPHTPPIVGHIPTRTQQVRYGGQYHPVQAPPSTYVHPSSQNVMVGRFGQVLYVHPVSQDMVPSATGFTQVSTCPLLAPHQIHHPKHQGTMPAQALQQLCMNPLFIPSAQPPFVVPSHIPISQPHFPIRPISVPGPNSFLGSKFS